MSKTDEIASARKQVDQIDSKIIALLAERFKVTRQIGVYKAAQDLVSRDPERENRQLAGVAKKADEMGINPELARKLLELIIDEAVKEHRDIRARQQT